MFIVVNKCHVFCIIFYIFMNNSTKIHDIINCSLKSTDSNNHDKRWHENLVTGNFIQSHISYSERSCYIRFTYKRPPLPLIHCTSKNYSRLRVSERSYLMNQLLCVPIYVAKRILLRGNVVQLDLPLLYKLAWDFLCKKMYLFMCTTTIKTYF